MLEIPSRILVLVFYFSFASTLCAQGIKVLDGVLETEISVRIDEEAVESYMVEGAGVEQVTILAEVPSYSISRSASGTFVVPDRGIVGDIIVEPDLGAVDLKFDHSTSSISIEGAVEDNYLEFSPYFSFAKLSGSASFEIEETQLFRINYPFGMNVNVNNQVHLTTADDISVLYCRTSDLEFIRDCSETPALTEIVPIEDPFMLDSGRYHLSFSVTTFVSTGGPSSPGALSFSLAIVPEPSSVSIPLIAVFWFWKNARKGPAEA